MPHTTLNSHVPNPTRAPTLHSTMRRTGRRGLHHALLLIVLQLLLLGHSFLIVPSPRRGTTTTCTMTAPQQHHPPTGRRRGGDASRGHVARAQHLQSWFVGAAAAVALVAAPPAPAQARQQPLGVIDELLAECPSEKACASSQDDRPPVFQEPWQYDDSTPERAMKRLRSYVESLPGAETITAEDRYLRLLFTDAGNGAEDDVEFFFTPNDSIIQFRVKKLSYKPSFFSSSHPPTHLLYRPPAAGRGPTIAGPICDGWRNYGLPWASRRFPSYGIGGAPSSFWSPPWMGGGLHTGRTRPAPRIWSKPTRTTTRWRQNGSRLCHIPGHHRAANKSKEAACAHNQTRPTADNRISCVSFLNLNLCDPLSRHKIIRSVPSPLYPLFYTLKPPSSSCCPTKARCCACAAGSPRSCSAAPPAPGTGAAGSARGQ